MSAKVIILGLGMCRGSLSAVDVLFWREDFSKDGQPQSLRKTVRFRAWPYGGRESRIADPFIVGPSILFGTD